ncbi:MULTISPECIES: lytic polysaccharide monooxygenase [Streptomyces]|uniref:Lytic polysaccharide monooxygenase n=1 Tax=Streptomyces lycii TaxID=2654337 RepID=A0ABQ7FFR1_9ACTN|nr:MULTISPECIES: lytic polysaccharide monooxygenase auxiliary activity family 9 protein [Streptomyces]KAF4407485.1 lytic polysaccharide monooxygenase [Streptomyces lycii]PGH48345.1 cellulose-binding protein [Streptomyces sp. Ru87]
MLCHDHAQNPRWIMRALVLLSAALLCLVPWAETATAHGSIVNPGARAYSCHERWGDDHMNPAMEQEDPMCWQAWQDNPNAMWNWNGLYRNGVGGNFQSAVPNGQLCSGGNAEGGRYRSMDAVGPWHMTNIGNNFRIELYDQASHGADFFQVYVTKQGFNPATQQLGWGNLDLVKTTGRYAPAQNISFDVSAPGRSGRHIVYTIWQASHMDQSYYLCSDVNFG